MLRRYQQYVWLSAFFLLCSENIYAQPTDTSAIVKQLTQQVKAVYAPDKRVTAWVINEPTQGTITGYTTEPAAVVLLKKKLDSANLVLSLNIETLPQKSLGAETKGIIRVSVAHHRFEPNDAAEMATQSLMGTPVDILMKKGGYYLVRTPDQYLAWTEAMMVYRTDEAGLRNWQQHDKIVVMSPFALLQEKPSKDIDVVTDLVAGNLLKLVRKKGRYYACELPDGRKGYLPKSAVALYKKWAGKKATVENVIQAGKNMLGTPYLWGGTSIKGVDCSGFVKTAYFINGVVLPRDASQQVLVGEAVDIKDHDTVSVAKALQNLLPGDLLFFSSLKDGKSTGRVTHVAMYLGNAMYIHASGMVRINSMLPGPDYADWETRAFVAAKRFITATSQTGVTPVAVHPYYNPQQ